MSNLTIGIVDKTIPELQTPEKSSVHVYNDTETKAEPIIFTDSNIKKYIIQLFLIE